MSISIPPVQVLINEQELKKLRKSVKSGNRTSCVLLFVGIGLIAMHSTETNYQRQEYAAELSSFIFTHTPSVRAAARLVRQSENGRAYTASKDKAVNVDEYFRPTTATQLKDIQLSGEARTEIRLLGKWGEAENRVHLKIYGANGPALVLWLDGKKQTYTGMLAHFRNDKIKHFGDVPSTSEIRDRYYDVSRTGLTTWVGTGEERLSEIYAAVGMYCPERGIHWVVVGPKPRPSTKASAAL